MYKPVYLQSGDLVCIIPTHLSSQKSYGILFFLEKQPFLLMPDGSIEREFSLDSLEWVCHTALVHSSCFHSLQQVRQDFANGAYDYVMGPIPKASNNNIDH